MGMAASQARYLGLTARKTNVEYEGQQINQQRTALANQSANFFNELNSLTVPTPPSTQQFTKMEYTYNDGLNNNVISNMTPLQATDPNYNYSVTHYNVVSQYTGVETKTTNPQVHGSKVVGPPPVYTFTSVGNSNLAAYDPNDSIQSGAVAQIVKNLPKSQFAADFTADTKNIYTFQSGGNTYFACKTDLAQSFDSTGGAIDNQVQLNKYNAVNLDQKVSTTENASVQVDSTGRFTNIKLASSSATYDLQANSVTDEHAYNDAMNQYTYNNQMYEKAVQDINAKTEVIQQEDRTLELRLRQCDTEQQALATEMDAVKKVIDKNIESTFKTFAG